MSKSRGLVPWGRKPPPVEEPKPSGLGLLLSGPPSTAPALYRTIQNPVPAAKPAVKSAAERPRLVFAVDRTASRAPAWEAAKKLQNRLLASVPDMLDVALASHGGNRVTFSDYLPDAEALQEIAAKLRCKAGSTQLLPILRRACDEGAQVVVYIGDVFEESANAAERCADMLKLSETRVIILHDTSSGDDASGDVFRKIAKRTGGCVLPFDPSAIEKLGELLEAVGCLAVGGEELVEEKKDTLPGAALLLEYLGKR
jgi:hypothetical protein